MPPAVRAVLFSPHVQRRTNRTLADAMMYVYTCVPPWLELGGCKDSNKVTLRRHTELPGSEDERGKNNERAGDREHRGVEQCPGHRVFDCQMNRGHSSAEYTVLSPLDAFPFQGQLFLARG